jgi:hypothetical protein
MREQHPASGYLFFQGRLDSELTGRIKRLRQEVRDYDSEQLSADPAVAVGRLVEKFGLAPVTFGSQVEFTVDSTSGAVLRVPFEGSSILLHRRSSDEDGDALAGRVVESVTRVDGVRQRHSWLLLQVPPALDEAFPEEREAWGVRALVRVRELTAVANDTLGDFDQRLRSAAAEAMSARMSRIASARTTSA